MSMLEAVSESGHYPSESTVSLVLSHTVDMDREKLMSFIQYAVKLSVKLKKQAAEIESLHLTLADLRRDCERMRTPLQSHSAPAHEQNSTNPPPLTPLLGQAQKSSKLEVGEESGRYVPEKNVSAARLRRRLKKSVCEQLNKNLPPLPSLPGQELDNKSSTSLHKPGVGERPGEDTAEESVEQIRHRLRNETASRLRRRVWEAAGSSGTSAPPNSL